jgi:hypothetical protein
VWVAEGKMGGELGGKGVAGGLWEMGHLISNMGSDWSKVRIMQ